jgi:hypothetical protein
MFILRDQTELRHRRRASRTTRWHLACFAITATILCSTGMLRQAKVSPTVDAASCRITSVSEASPWHIAVKCTGR